MIAKAKKFSSVVQNQQQVADFFDRKIQTVGQWRSRGMPGKPGRYDLREILKWALAEGLLVPISRAAQGDEVGPQSLGRQRQAKAELLEMEVLQRKRALLPRDDLRNSLGILASMIKQKGEQLCRRYGPDASVFFSDLLEDYHRVISNEFGGNGHLPREPARGPDLVRGSSPVQADQANQPVD